MSGDAGKGDLRRPTDWEKWDTGWENIKWKGNRNDKRRNEDEAFKNKDSEEQA